MKCFVFHRWESTYKNGAEEVQKCVRCGKYRSSMYDLATGDTYWVDGIQWGNANEL